jgi:hypothetical protein
MKVRKKPVVVEAHQFIASDPMWPAGVFANPVIPGEFKIETLEGVMVVKDRSYIITGVKGEKWAIREDVFLETYETVEEELPRGRRVLVGDLVDSSHPCG